MPQGKESPNGTTMALCQAQSGDQGLSRELKLQVYYRSFIVVKYSLNLVRC